MSSTNTPATDDRITVVAIAAIACVVQDVLHEGLGHGVTAWLSGAKSLVISTVALQSDVSTRWISANGTLVNLLFAGLFWLLLRRPRQYSPALRYFLVLAMAGNLFTGTGYFLFSGFSNFGDWAEVIRGWQPHWLWQLGLIVTGFITYGLSVMLVAAQLKPFVGRLRVLAWLPYVADGLLAGLGGLLNPLGLFYVFASALPSTLGANAGLLSLPSIMRGWTCPEENRAGPIARSIPWIVAGAGAAGFFIFVLGRGLTWHR